MEKAMKRLIIADADVALKALDEESLSIDDDVFVHDVHESCVRSLCLVRNHDGDAVLPAEYLIA